MAKKMRRFLVLCLVLAFSISMIATPAMAARDDRDDNGNQGSGTEYIVINVNGAHLKTISGSEGDHTWLVQGTYKYSYSMSGNVLSYTVGKQSGSITIPMPAGFEGCTAADVNATCTWGGGTNSESASYDNAIINVTFTKVVTPGGEIVDITDPTEPDPTDPPATEPPVTEPPVTEPPVTEPPVTEPPVTEPPVTEPPVTEPPKPVETAVTVNHIYYTYDVYTGETTKDGSTTGSETAIEGDTYTATAVTTYGGNTYTQQSVDPAMTITIQADAAENVIDIAYIRTIDTTPINYTPVLSIVKTADKAVYETGETITWTITVKNVSEHTAYNVVVTDELTGDSWSIASLAPGAEKSFTATTENAAAGSVKNVAVATWEDGDDIPDEDEPNEIKKTSDDEIVSINDPEPENYIPVLSVVKTAGKEVYEFGETITWTITVKNVSDYTAYNVVVVDELAKGYWTIESLAPGAEKVFTATMENVAAGSVKNVVVTTWEDGDDIPDEDEPNETKETSDEEIVVVEEPEDFAPVLTVTKVANKATYKPGQTIKWTITVKNISEHTAYYVVVVDELTGDEWNIESLAPGAEKVFTATSKAGEVGSVKNVVVVSWEDGDEIPDEEEPEEITETSDEETVKVKEPEEPGTPAETEDPTEPPKEEETPDVPVAQNDEIEIPDEEVPLAAAPKTGDISVLWIALSGISAGGMIVLGKKRKDDEE